MVRLSDLTTTARDSALALECPVFDEVPWVSGPKLSDRCVTLISSAGLMQPGESPFKGGEASYRVIENEVPDSKLTCGHISVNFDRTGLQRDLNVVHPRLRLAELAEQGVIGSVADAHYTFMGATDPEKMEHHARELAARLRSLGVDSAIFAPV